MFVSGDAAMMMAKGMAGGKSEPVKTKLPCPDCKSNLVFTENGVIHHAPPRMRVKCSTCPYKGFHPVKLPENSTDISNQIQVSGEHAEDFRTELER